MSERCETCRYWEHDDEQCRRRSPTIKYEDDGSPYRTWPFAHYFDWCGEHKPRAEPAMSLDELTRAGAAFLEREP